MGIQPLLWPHRFFSESCLNLSLERWAPVPDHQELLAALRCPAGRDTHPEWEPGTSRPLRVGRGGCWEENDLSPGTSNLFNLYYFSSTTRLNLLLEPWMPVPVPLGTSCRFGVPPAGETHTLGENQGLQEPPPGSGAGAAGKARTSAWRPQPFLQPPRFLSAACLNLSLEPWPPVPVPRESSCRFRVPQRGRDTHPRWKPGDQPGSRARAAENALTSAVRTQPLPRPRRFFSSVCLNLPLEPWASFPVPRGTS